jgi:hypothetical protein
MQSHRDLLKRLPHLRCAKLRRELSNSRAKPGNSYDINRNLMVMIADNRQNRLHGEIGVDARSNWHRNAHGRRDDQPGNRGVAGRLNDRFADQEFAKRPGSNSRLDSLLQIPPEMLGKPMVQAAVHKPEGIGRTHNCVTGQAANVFANDLNIWMPRKKSASTHRPTTHRDNTIDTSYYNQWESFIFWKRFPSRLFSSASSALLTFSALVTKLLLRHALGRDAPHPRRGCPWVDFWQRSQRNQA